MAVTTEPPWLHLGTGVGDRNGTTSHTIGHSTAATAPSTGCSLGFVPTAGSLLVVISAGSTTSVSAGAGAGSGWTQQQHPVNAAELAMFTKTADGNDFITLSHGTDSNYPIAYALYEFPSGSSHTLSTGQTNTADTFPALATLPGTEQVIIAAFARAITTAASGDSTVTSPWVEDFDSLTADGATDGIYLYVFHQINVTTSITPVFTLGQTGGATNQQKIVGAFAVASASPPANTNQFFAMF